MDLEITRFNSALLNNNRYYSFENYIADVMSKFFPELKLSLVLLFNKLAGSHGPCISHEMFVKFALLLDSSLQSLDELICRHNFRYERDYIVTYINDNAHEVLFTSRALMRALFADPQFGALYVEQYDVYNKCLTSYMDYLQKRVDLNEKNTNVAPPQILNSERVLEGIPVARIGTYLFLMGFEPYNGKLLINTYKDPLYVLNNVRNAAPNAKFYGVFKCNEIDRLNETLRSLIEIFCTNHSDHDQWHEISEKKLTIFVHVLQKMYFRVL